MHCCSFTAGSVETCSACAASPTTHRYQGTTPASLSLSANPATRCCAALLPSSSLSVDAMDPQTTCDRAGDGLCVMKEPPLDSVDDLDIIDLHIVLILRDFLLLWPSHLSDGLEQVSWCCVPALTRVMKFKVVWHRMNVIDLDQGIATWIDLHC